MTKKTKYELGWVAVSLLKTCNKLEELSNIESQTDPAASEQILMIKDYIQTQMEELNEFIEE